MVGFCEDTVFEFLVRQFRGRREDHISVTEVYTVDCWCGVWEEGRGCRNEVWGRKVEGARGEGGRKRDKGEGVREEGREIREKG